MDLYYCIALIVENNRSLIMIISSNTKSIKQIEINIIPIVFLVYYFKLSKSSLSNVS